jgi:hypothetical protein
LYLDWDVNITTAAERTLDRDISIIPPLDFEGILKMEGASSLPLVTSYTDNFQIQIDRSRQREITEPLAGATTNGSVAADQEATTGKQVSGRVAEKAKGQAIKNKLVAA